MSVETPRYEVATSATPDWYYLVNASDEDTEFLKSFPGARLRNNVLEVHSTVVETSEDFKVVFADFSKWMPKSRSLDYESGNKIYGEVLRPYQREGVDFITTRSGTLLADDVGIGKTLQTITGTILYGVSPVLVLGTLLSKNVWCGANSDAKKFFGIDIVPISSRKYANKEVFADRKQQWFFCHYDILEAWVPWICNYLRPQTVVFDEAHKMSHKSKRGRSAQAIARFKDVRKRVVITATPVQNSRQDIWLPLHLATPDAFGDYHTFGRRFSGAVKSEYGWVYDGETHNEELKERMSKVMIRRTKAEVMKWLPDIVREAVEVELSESAKEEYGQYKEAERDIRAFLKNYEGKSLAAGISGERLIQLTKLMSLVSKAKTSATTELAIDTARALKKVVVFCWFKDSARTIARGIAQSGVEVYGPVTGEDSVEVRIKKAQQFAASTEPSAFVATLAAASESINELVACQEMITNDLIWTIRVLLQAEGRLHRGGQKGSVHSVYVVANGTIDADLMDVLYKKANASEALGIVDDGKTLIQGLGGEAPEDDVAKFVKAMQAQITDNGFGLDDEDLED